MNNLPSELFENIYYWYVPIYTQKMKEVHKQLLTELHFLTMTDNIFDFYTDFHFVERIPALSPGF